MEAPDADELERALEAIQDERVEECERILKQVQIAGPGREEGYHHVRVGTGDEDESSPAEKAWVCVDLALERLEEERFAIVRASLHSAIDHVRGEVQPGTSVDDPGESLFGSSFGEG